ncbi:pyrimidine reductase family protein [Amycolatopsis sp. OK19-0408]|uniref:Pyrimidine reductase family protein n=1 Tax=Amycolatopsis iheyensis TaxID=2945988 RepID=A0A9X2SKN7_9PSEU|nr:pyrimidine reductase family protein [Amycolatopsis iheyensis]MCR6483610.1 pyrimidine reductase family protein [Amycolatopsis iheyensis]
MIRQIWPPEDGRELDLAELEDLYRFPDVAKWLVVNFVSSTDGAITVGGRSRPLSTAPDRVVFKLGSDLADVVLLGAGTAVIEEFDGVHPGKETADRRRRHGLEPIPPIAVVTTGASLPPSAPVLTEAAVPTLVITSERAPRDLREAWKSAGAEVIVAGEDEVALDLAVAALTERGLRRIDCEGGPRLFASLAEAGLVDEFRLTVAPFLVAGTADRAAVGGAFDPVELALATVLTDGASLLTRYLAP